MSDIFNSSIFQVFEFRRYTIKPGERERFAKYFETWFPESIQQLGGLVFGSFLERKNGNMFTWIRGFPNTEIRAIANTSLYYGPLWKEHKQTMNDLMNDSDNVLLLCPINPSRGLLVLSSVDPAYEADVRHGVLVAQVFQVKPGEVEQFAKEADSIFVEYRNAGAREAGILATLEVPNSFPQHPVRDDGPFVVWLGILPDDQTLQSEFMPIVERSSSRWGQMELLRGDPEVIVLDPTPRSRLR